ncbi:MAG TPA: hypothetical protein VHG08_10420 [Longimicrobium sp.]|nr:hypothetical protein [Longimicrobium sp.]
MRALWKAVVTAGLMAAGAVFGALAAGLTIVALEMVPAADSLVPERAFILAAAGVGAGAGAVLGRIGAITAGLMAVGALFGGVASALAVLGFLLWEGGSLQALRVMPGALLFGAICGALLGAVLGPVAAWMLMRHVPLGLAVAGTTLGSLTGAGIGMLTGDTGHVVAGALMGFAVSAVGLRFAVPRPDRTRLRAGVARVRLASARS